MLSAALELISPDAKTPSKRPQSLTPHLVRVHVRKQHVPHAKHNTSFMPRPVCLTPVPHSQQDATRPQKKKEAENTSRAKRTAYSENIKRVATHFTWALKHPTVTAAEVAWPPKHARESPPITLWREWSVPYTREQGQSETSETEKKTT